MTEQTRSEKTRGDSGTHVTTRRGFVTGLGFGVVSLYGLWAAYGAAPTSLGFMSEGTEAMASMGQGGHGMGSGMTVEAFEDLADEFIEANSLPDGTVKPTRGWRGRRSSGGHAMAEMDGAEGDAHGAAQGHEEPAAHGDEDGPIDVYLLASRYGYQPDFLRLETGVPYRFRIMAIDADHGASLQMRVAGRMIRCPARVLTEQVLTFTAPGSHLVYCTVYCGLGHDVMMGQIVVT